MEAETPSLTGITVQQASSCPVLCPLAGCVPIQIFVPVTLAEIKVGVHFFQNQTVIAELVLSFSINQKGQYGLEFFSGYAFVKVICLLKQNSF